MFVRVTSRDVILRGRGFRPGRYRLGADVSPEDAAELVARGYAVEERPARKPRRSRPAPEPPESDAEEG